MALNLLPLSQLGAIETDGMVTFGLWLPWVSATDGNQVSVKIIHEADQFLQRVPPREFPLTHSVREPYGDFWSTTVPIAGTAPEVPGSAWGSAGRYVYRYTIRNPAVGLLDWIIDPSLGNSVLASSQLSRSATSHTYGVSKRQTGRRQN